MGSPPLRRHVDASPALVSRVEALVQDHLTLRDAVAWAATLDPPRTPADIVTQDEYTHDVVIEFDRGLYLVYDVN